MRIRVALVVLLLIVSGCTRSEVRLFPEPVSSITIENDPVVLRPIPFGDWIYYRIKIRNPTSHQIVLNNITIATQTGNLGQGFSTSEIPGRSLVLGPGEVSAVDCKFYVGPSQQNVNPNRYIAVRFFSPLGSEDVMFERKFGDILFGLQLCFQIGDGEMMRPYLIRYHIDESSRHAYPYFILGRRKLDRTTRKWVSYSR